MSAVPFSAEKSSRSPFRLDFGIASMKNLVEKASQRFPYANFLQTSWYNDG
jgi:hypothetical protein